MNFGEAIEELKSGEMVQRQCWNSKGMWIRLEVPHDESYMTLPYIYMRTAEADLVPWNPSHTEMLADDWGVLSCHVKETAVPRRPPIQNTSVPLTSGNVHLK